MDTTSLHHDDIGGVDGEGKPTGRFRQRTFGESGGQSNQYAREVRISEQMPTSFDAWVGNDNKWNRGGEEVDRGSRERDFFDNHLCVVSLYIYIYIY